MLVRITQRDKETETERQIQGDTERGRVVYEAAGPRLQIAGPDLPARCQLISAFQKSSRGTMDRLTPPYKRAERPTVNRETGGQRGTETDRAAANTSSDCPQRI